jgi:hypothetical protein
MTVQRSNAGGGVLMQEEATSKDILSTRVQYAILIFVPSFRIFRAQYVNVGCVVQFMDTRQTL